MTPLISNRTSSQIFNKTGSSFPISFNPNITTFSIGSSYILTTGSDGHIYEQGNANQLLAQSNVECSVPFFLTDGNQTNINSGIVTTSESFAKVNINTIYGNFNFQFPSLMAGQPFSFIYRNTSSLEIQITNTISSHYINSASLGGQFSPSYLNTNQCWVKGMDFTGCGFTNLQSYRWITLITSQFGISCNHSPPIVGETVYFYDGNSNILDSCPIASSSQCPNTDIQLIQMSRPISSSCTPRWVLPTNWQNYIPDTINSFNEPLFPCIIPNNNIGQMQCRGLSNFTGLSAGEITTNALIPNCDFTSNTLYTGGESSSPCQTIVNGQMVFLYAMHYANASGPMISYSSSFAWISSSILPQTMSIVNLSSYQSIF